MLGAMLVLVAFAAGLVLLMGVLKLTIAP
jgi:hypothetical protein